MEHKMEKVAEMIVRDLQIIKKAEPHVIDYEGTRKSLEFLKQADLTDILGSITGFLGKNKWVMPTALGGLGALLGGRMGGGGIMGPLLGLLLGGGGGFGLQKLMENYLGKKDEGELSPEFRKELEAEGGDTYVGEDVTKRPSILANVPMGDKTKPQGQTMKDLADKVKDQKTGPDFNKQDKIPQTDGM